ncbi:MAG TPA: hypothetical protein DIS62_03395 [Candidatus Kerfeldbacteria bacterium]|nr:MAG: UDP-N-acetylmuramyl-tripeptide synthetase [Parcubacteria group bacterium GW2011_GWA2_48_9]KKW16510.1 MAG: UDP-N-acetylmuramyl-tripeptide synthetase [Parcubacteria group bacterium GW2011_GWC2_49_9]HCM68021.1 hypothetical protein [Candidatus Kerfeldbacteria bacterium]
MSLLYNAKSLIRAFMPEWAVLLYHQTLADAGALWYRHPSRSMVVIGVTGTKGKTSVVHLIAHILMHAGKRVGFVTGVTIRVGDRTWPNTMKMTMPGRLKLQWLLREMANDGCEYAIVETTSEGIRQHRHRGIEYDVAVVTNVTPEHIESHGSFGAYLAAKGKLVAALAGSRKKVLKGVMIQKVKVLNKDDEHHQYFERFFSDMNAYFSTDERQSDTATDYVARSIQVHDNGSVFRLRGTDCSLPMLGKHNVSNALCAMAVCETLGVPLQVVIEAIATSKPASGRLEEIETGKKFRVFVDYAHEPASLRALYEAIRLLRPKRLIAVLGSQGGGRDHAKRPVMGSIAAEFANVVFITNEDPYDEDPKSIVDDVARGVLENTSKKFVEGNTLYKIVDRKAAIETALSYAREGDVVCISGKGGELIMAVAGGKNIPWDDRVVVREWLKK